MEIDSKTEAEKTIDQKNHLGGWESWRCNGKVLSVVDKWALLLNKQISNVLT